MKAMFAAFIAIGVIAIGSNLVLNSLPLSSADQNSSSSVRLGK